MEIPTIRIDKYSRDIPVINIFRNSLTDSLIQARYRGTGYLRKIEVEIN